MSGLSVRNSSASHLSTMLKPLIALQKNRHFNRVESVGYMAIAALVITLASVVGAVSTHDDKAKTPSRTNQFFKGLGCLSAGGLLLTLGRLIQLAFKANK